MLLLAEQNRAFGYAVAASLALHALLLLNLPALRDAVAPPAEPPLVAHLVEPPAPPAPPAPEVKAQEPAKPTPPRRVAKAKPKPPPRVAAPAAIPEPTPPAPPMAEPAPPAAAPAPPRAEPAPPAAAAAPSARPDPQAERERFRQALIARAEQIKRYPRKAVDEGWAGQVTVRIEMADNGSVASVRVKSSSGNSLLDAVAVEIFSKAAAQVAVPPALRGNAFAVDVPAIYKFTD